MNTSNSNEFSATQYGHSIHMNSSSFQKGSGQSGRRSGFPNYKREILLNIINDILPVGQEHWKEVANRYKVAASENCVRDSVDLKRHFLEKLCDRNKKPTGVSSPKPEIQRVQKIYRRILQRENSCSIGEGNDSECDNSEEEFSDSESENGVDTVFAPSSQDYQTSSSTQGNPCVPHVVDLGIVSPKKQKTSSAFASGPLVIKDNKSKNSRNGVGRGTAASAMVKIADAMCLKAESSKVNMDIRLEELKAAREEAAMTRKEEKEERDQEQ
jgi:hypothetical protein